MRGASRRVDFRGSFLACSARWRGARASRAETVRQGLDGLAASVMKIGQEKFRLSRQPCAACRAARTRTLTNRRPERNFNLLNLEVYFRKVVGRRRMMVARSLMLGLACSRPGGEKLSTLRSGNPGSGIPKLQPARLGNTQKLRSFFPLSPPRARRSPRRGSGCSKVVCQANPALAPPAYVQRMCLGIHGAVKGRSNVQTRCICDCPQIQPIFRFADCSPHKESGKEELDSNSDKSAA